MFSLEEMAIAGVIGVVLGAFIIYEWLDFNGKIRK